MATMPTGLPLFFGHVIVALVGRDGSNNCVANPYGQVRGPNRPARRSLVTTTRTGRVSRRNP